MSGHVPAFSEPVDGTPIPEAAFPLNRQRRVTDRGTHMLETHQKRGEDTLDWSIDLVKWLEPDEVVTAAQAVVGPVDLVVQRLYYAPTGVVVWLTGGEDATAHEVRCLITTSQGRIKLFRFRVITRGVPVIVEATLLISIDSITVSLPNQGGGDPPPDPDPVPLVSLSPLSLSFGQVAGGGGANLILTITNIGTANLIISSAVATGDFEVIGSELA